MIRSRGLSKSYRLGGYGVTSLRDEIVEGYQRLFSGGKTGDSLGTDTSGRTFWALRDIDFEIVEGETVGLIGRNGAGKSTLLKLLARITSPTRGRAEINGKVAALLEVGTGFHPELTGMENIYLNGAILGMRRYQVKSLIDDIVEFAGMEQFVDTPVKRYSSGMKVRLAFAVAAHLQQEIMIVDEVLAVGDRDFQKKCISKMGEVAQQGRTVILVSHNMMTISQLCDRVIYLREGEIVKDGATDAVIKEYLQDGTTGRGEFFWKEGIADPGVSEFALKSIKLCSADGKVSSSYSILDTIDLEVEFEIYDRIWAFAFKTMLRSSAGVPVMTISNVGEKVREAYIEPGKYMFRCQIPSKRINHGNYSLSVGASSVNSKFLLRLDDIMNFDIDLIGNENESLILSNGVIYPDLVVDCGRIGDINE